MWGGGVCGENKWYNVSGKSLAGNVASVVCVQRILLDGRLLYSLMLSRMCIKL